MYTLHPLHCVVCSQDRLNKWAKSQLEQWHQVPHYTQKPTAATAAAITAGVGAGEQYWTQLDRGHRGGEGLIDYVLPGTGIATLWFL